MRKPRSAKSPRERPAVVLIGSEAVPFAKSGGLADVLGSLPLALDRLGWSTTLIVPHYRGVIGGELVDRFPVTCGGYTREFAFFSVPLGGEARAVLVDCPDLFERDDYYSSNGHDYPDNARRFAMLVRAALEFTARHGGRPSVVHAHDWHAGLAPVYLNTLYASHPVLGGTPSVLTIHNLAYQGLFEPDWLPRLDLPWGLLTVDGLEFWGRISFLKGGINYADLITTVSPQYAKEVQTPDMGFGFDGILRQRSADLVGIRNGIDTRVWDPLHDSFLPAPFDGRDLGGKVVAKRALLMRYGMTVHEATLSRPLIAMVSRMIYQKGFDLVAAIADAIPRFNATWIVLGTGEDRYQRMWTDLAARHPDRIGARITFSEEMAHLIEGGADMFLMPSKFEPCGLNQMYSLRYGTVPIVHAVGGLVDTVHDADPGDPESTGFIFREYTPAALLAALERALTVFADRGRWRTLQLTGMRQDNSWDRSAREYVKIYERVAKVRGSSPGATQRVHNGPG